MKQVRETDSKINMKFLNFSAFSQFLLSVAVMAAAASAAPRYLIIPLDNVEFVDQEMPSVQPYPMVYNHRVARQLQEEEPVYSSPISSRPQPVANRREGIP